MKILLDTHIFLWLISGNHRLSETLRETIQDPENEIYLSVVSIWETIIKYQLGKLPLPEPPELYLPRQRDLHRVDSLVIDEKSVAILPTLHRLHRDPFYRMLICQAIQHGLTIATEDVAIRAYPVTVTA